MLRESLRDVEWSTGTAGGAGVAPCRETDHDHDRDHDHDHDHARDHDREPAHQRQYESREFAAGCVGSVALCGAWGTS
jgi:hypothetical protein